MLDSTTTSEHAPRTGGYSARTSRHAVRMAAAWSNGRAGSAREHRVRLGGEPSSAGLVRAPDQVIVEKLEPDLLIADLDDELLARRLCRRARDERPWHGEHGEQLGDRGGIRGLPGDRRAA